MPRLERSDAILAPVARGDEGSPIERMPTEARATPRCGPCPQEGWAVQALGTLPGDAFSNAHDVNDAGAVVGGSGSGQLHAVVWRLP